MTEEKSSESSDKISFYKKLNKMRDECNGLDWTTDKHVGIGMKGYDYISIYKMKRNLAPLFAKHGIEFIPKYHDIETKQAGAAYQWVVHLDATMIDIDTGYEVAAQTIGCSPTTDKGPTVAMAYALKQWLSDQFFLIDGMIDPDAGEEDNTGKSFVAKTPKEDNEARSQILAKSIRPMNVDEPAVSEPKEESTPIAKPAEVKAEPAPVVEKEYTFEEDKPGIPVPQMNAIKKIFNVRTTWAKEGKMSVEEYNQMSADYLEVTDGQSAVVFIKKYRVM